jgi:hypothetical protein
MGSYISWPSGIYTYIIVFIQGVSGGIVNILGGGGMDYSE